MFKEGPEVEIKIQLFTSLLKQFPQSNRASYRKNGRFEVIFDGNQIGDLTGPENQAYFNLLAHAWLIIWGNQQAELHVGVTNRMGYRLEIDASKISMGHKFRDHYKELDKMLSLVDVTRGEGSALGQKYVRGNGIGDGYKYCPNCGRKTDGSGECPQCGIIFWKHKRRQEEIQRNQPVEIGGWISVFCFLITVMGPFWGLVNMLADWDRLQTPISPHAAIYSTIKIALVWEYFGLGALILYGVIVGSIIWRGSPNGRALAMQYLIARIIGKGIVTLISLGVLSTELSPAMMNSVHNKAVGIAFVEVSWFLIWWLYFNKSKRVMNTYGVN